MQVFYSPDHVRREPILAAVGELQFDVVASRLETEYGVKTLVERMPFVLARWISGDPDVLAGIYWPQDTRRLVDRDGSMVMLFGSERLLTYCMREYPSLKFQLREEAKMTEP
jgi:peptide chain release factor 3